MPQSNVAAPVSTKRDPNLCNSEVTSEAVHCIAKLIWRPWEDRIDAGECHFARREFDRDLSVEPRKEALEKFSEGRIVVSDEIGGYSRGEGGVRSLSEGTLGGFGCIPSGL